MDLNLTDITLVLIIMTAGTTLQSTIGFGLGLFAGPFLVLIDRSFVPGPMLFAAMIMAMILTVRDYRAIDMQGVKYSIFGRLISTPLAALVVGMVSIRLFDLLFGILILVAVAISLIHRNIMPTSRNVFIAGVMSGFMSTIGSIGGPPLALVYQNSGGPKLRGTLSAMFTLGCLMSLIALVAVGKFGLADFYRAGLLLAGVILGLIIAIPLTGKLKDSAIRNYVLGVCSMAALMVLGRALLQFIHPV